MKIYRGFRGENKTHVEFSIEGKTLTETSFGGTFPLELCPSLRIAYLSPTGYEWGLECVWAPRRPISSRARCLVRTLSREAKDLEGRVDGLLTLLVAPSIPFEGDEREVS